MKKLLTTVFLMLALLATSAGTVFAQAATPITGTVQSVVLVTDATTGETTVRVSVLDEATGTTQTVSISLVDAEFLGLVTTDLTTSVSTVVESAIGTVVVIDPAVVIPIVETPTTTEEQHPVGSALSDFFGELLGVDYETIMAAHEDGAGFGVITQALWLTNKLEGDTGTFKALMKAKQSGDYSAITLADGSTPDNWGDVVKSLKTGDNLGSVMSGKAENGNDATTTESSATNGHGNGNEDKGKDKDNGGSNEHEGNNGNGDGNNGNGGGNGNGSGHP